MSAHGTRPGSRATSCAGAAAGGQGAGCGDSRRSAPQVEPRPRALGLEAATASRRSQGAARDRSQSLGAERWRADVSSHAIGDRLSVAVSRFTTTWSRSPSPVRSTSTPSRAFAGRSSPTRWRATRSSLGLGLPRSRGQGVHETEVGPSRSRGHRRRGRLVVQRRLKLRDRRADPRRRRLSRPMTGPRSAALIVHAHHGP